MKDKSVRMETAFRVLGCLCAALFLSVTSDAKDWRGIVPLHSTRADVENLLGEPPPPPKDGSRVYTLNKPPTPSPTVAPHEVVPVFEEQKPRRRRRRARP